MWQLHGGERLWLMAERLEITHPLPTVLPGETYIQLVEMKDRLPLDARMLGNALQGCVQVY